MVFRLLFAVYLFVKNDPGSFLCLSAKAVPGLHYYNTKALRGEERFREIPLLVKEYRPVVKAYKGDIFSMPRDLYEAGCGYHAIYRIEESYLGSQD